MKLFDEFDGITCDGKLLHGGFLQVPIKILIDDRISPGAKLSYTALLWYNFKKRPYPGHTQASLDFAIPERSLRRYLKELVVVGHLQVIRRRHKPNVYHLPQPQLKALAVDPEPQKTKSRPSVIINT